MAQQKVFAIIVSAGDGKRMGMDRNKGLVELAGRPILSYSLDIFERCGSVTGMVVVVRGQDREEIGRLVTSGGYKKVLAIVEGGVQRQDSVRAGIGEIENSRHPQDTDVLLVHNSANPLVTQDEVDRVIDATISAGAASVGSPVRDTLKMVNTAGLIIRTVKRSGMFAMQTPQGLAYGVAKKAFKKAYEEGFYGTDDITLAERIGVRPIIVPANERNIKITTRQDLAVAEFILSKRGGER
jgi:2-C-methyl-D-erythritol 4-phosphate cytidylyltransferase